MPTYAHSLSLISTLECDDISTRGYGGRGEVRRRHGVTRISQRLLDTFKDTYETVLTKRRYFQT